MNKWARKEGVYHDENGRVCITCLVYKPWGEFGKNKRGPNGKQGHCKTCISLINALRNKKRREHKAAVGKIWRINNKEHNTARGKAYYENNKERRYATSARRRAAKLQRTVPWIDWGEIMAFFKYSNKLTEEIGIQHSVDHIYALQGVTVSGLHVPENLRVITGSENDSKGNKYPYGEWDAW